MDQGILGESSRSLLADVFNPAAIEGTDQRSFNWRGYLDGNIDPAILSCHLIGCICLLGGSLMYTSLIANIKKERIIAQRLFDPSEPQGYLAYLGFGSAFALGIVGLGFISFSCRRSIRYAYT